MAVGGMYGATVVVGFGGNRSSAVAERAREKRRKLLQSTHVHNSLVIDSRKLTAGGVAFIDFDRVFIHLVGIELNQL